MFTNALNYWQQRKKQFGDKAVGNVAEDHVRQGTVIGAELNKLLGSKFFTHGLDFGCGYGRLTPYLVAHCAHLWVTDLFGDWTTRAATGHKTITPVTLSSYSLPFVNDSFDLITDIMTVQSVPADDRRIVAKELARVLTPGGTMILLAKKDVVEKDDYALIEQLCLSDQDAVWLELTNIDKKRDEYCLILGTRL